jgi:hypothetical protein
MYVRRKRRVTLARYLSALCSSSDLVRQLRVDLPRMRCVVNGVRARSIKEFHVALHADRASRSRLSENALSCMLMPFATQTVMAEPVVWLQSLLGSTPVLDGRSPLSVRVNLDDAGWSVSARKIMVVYGRGAVLMRVGVCSDNQQVCISLENADADL